MFPRNMRKPHDTCKTIVKNLYHFQGWLRSPLIFKPTQMLVISGTVKGNTYDEQVISAENLLKLFNIDLPAKRNGEVQFNTVKKKFNSFIGKPEFSGIYEGKQIKVRYFESRIGSKDNPKYLPTHLPEVAPPAFTLNMQRDSDFVAFMILTPHCEDSPIKNRVAVKRWRLHKPELEASKKVNYSEKVRQAFDLIDKTDENVLRRKAKGMYGRADIIDMGIKEVKALFTDDIMASPESFLNKFLDEKTSITGIVHDAFEHGLFTHLTAGAAVVIKWGHNIQGGVEIARIPKGTDVKEYMAEYVLKNTSIIHILQEWYNKSDLKKTIAAFDGDAKIQSLINEEWTEETINGLKDTQALELAITKEVIAFNYKEKAVNYIVDGSPESKDYKIKDASNWKDEFLNEYIYPHPNAAKKLRRMLVAKLVKQ
jgi:hypothetical protein